MPDLRWIKYVPGTAWEMLVGQRAVEDASKAEKKRKRARKVQEAAAGNSPAAKYRKATDESIDFIMNQ